MRRLHRAMTGTNFRGDYARELHAFVRDLLVRLNATRDAAERADIQRELAPLVRELGAVQRRQAA